MKTADNSLDIGAILDNRYHIEGVLGIGGFGVTYKAHDDTLDCTVVIKEYLPEECGARDSDTVSVIPRTNREDDYQYGLEKYLDEARTLAKFKHPNIVRVSNFLKTNGTAYFVMDYDEGEDLTDWLKKHDTLNEDIILKIITPILEGLAEVHKTGLLHRDIKPGNIFMRKKGGAMLIDFGAARQALGEQSKSISAIISQGYAPPEQYTTRGKQGAFTDLYAIGATLYKLITGKAPIESADRAHEIHEGEADPMIPAMEAGKGKVGDWLLQLTDQMLKISGKDRPQNAEVVLEAIKNKTTAVGCAARTETQAEPDNKTRVVRSSQRFDKKSKSQPEQKTNDAHGAPYGKIAAVMVVVVAIAGGGWWFTQADTNESVRMNSNLQEAQVTQSKTLAKGNAILESLAGKMITIPAGSFQMGSNENSDEKPVHRVSLKTFKLGQHEVTQKQWWAVMDRNPSSFKRCDDCPVEKVSWNDIQEFLKKLNQQTGQTFRLPSEAEWEYACRSGGKDQKYCGGSNKSSLAWYDGSSGKKTHTVKQKQANGLGLYDMSGNVWEWTQDCWNNSYNGAPTSGDAWQSGDCTKHVLRGGAWNFKLNSVRSANRDWSPTGKRNNNNGFRLAQDVQENYVDAQDATIKHIALMTSNMINIPAGSFQMGNNNNERPAHRVSLKAFKLGQHEVTQKLWQAVMGNNPSSFKDCDDCPVEQVSWNDIQGFLKKLKQQTGQTFRLPSEAEWEYACRSGGKDQKYCGGNSEAELAWYDSNSGNKTHPVKQKQANGLSLYDMSGNVWEWTQDCWNGSYSGAPSNGDAWQSGDCAVRIIRGGSLSYDPYALRSAFRGRFTADKRNDKTGFRLAQD